MSYMDTEEYKEMAARRAEKLAQEKALETETTAKWPTAVLELGKVWCRGEHVRLYLNAEKLEEKEVLWGVKMSNNKRFQLRDSYINLRTGKLQAPDWAQGKILDYIEEMN